LVSSDFWAIREQLRANCVETKKNSLKVKIVAFLYVDE